MIIINEKEYNYNLQREHIPLFTKIIGKLKLKPDLTGGFNEILLMISMIQEALLNFDVALEDTLVFVSAIYNVEPQEIKDLGFINELKLWEHFLNDKDIVSFLSRVFKSKMMDMKRN